MTVEQARAAAEVHVGRRRQGEDPAAEKREKRAEGTLGSLWQTWLTVHAEAKKKPASIVSDRGSWTRYLMPWANRKVGAIQYRDVQTLHAHVGKEHGKYAANRMLALLRGMYNLATDRREFTGANPCLGIKPFAEKSRDRYLQPDEIPRLLKALDAEQNQLAADALRLMLWTGARKSNVLAMRWQDVLLRDARWRIPETKAGEPQWVHLAPEAVEILSRLAANAEDGAHYVFPASRAGTANGHLVDIVKVWTRVTTAADLPKLRMHDLRRSLGSWMAATGASLPIIGKTLGHHDPAATKIYAHVALDPVRKSVDAAVAAMLATVPTPTEGGES
jgi:integrase